MCLSAASVSFFPGPFLSPKQSLEGMLRSSPQQQVVVICTSDNLGMSPVSLNLTVIADKMDA